MTPEELEALRALLAKQPDPDGDPVDRELGAGDASVTENRFVRVSTAPDPLDPDAVDRSEGHHWLLPATEDEFAHVERILAEVHDRLIEDRAREERARQALEALLADVAHDLRGGQGAWRGAAPSCRPHHGYSNPGAHAQCLLHRSGGEHEDARSGG